MLDLEALSLIFCPTQGAVDGANGSWEPIDLHAHRSVQKPIDAQRLRLKEHINSAIERDIIPRLMITYVMHDSQKAVALAEPLQQARQDVARQPPALDYERLAMQAVLEDVDTLRERLDELVQDGMPLTEVFLGLMAPAARHLGHLWTLDAIDFSSVTIGLTRLQQLVHSYGAVFTTPSREDTGQRRRALLVPAPGEQHTFGLIMVGEFMRRAGWQTMILPSFGRDEMISAIKSNPFDIVGVSLGKESCFDDVRGLLKHIRKAARKRALGIMVGGNAINGAMEKVQYLGADATAADGRHVAAEAAKLVDLRANNC